MLIQSKGCILVILNIRKGPKFSYNRVQLETTHVKKVRECNMLINFILS